MSEINRPELLAKWAPLLNSDAFESIQSKHRKEVTAVLLENTERELSKESSSSGFLTEAGVAANVGGASLSSGMAGSATGSVAGVDPVLIALVRRAAPQLIAYDVCGVQPMTQPTGLIFAMKSRYSSQNGTEALFNEADTEFSGALDSLFDGTATRVTGPTAAQVGTDPFAASLNTGVGMTTSQAEGGVKGDNTYASPLTFNEMSFSIERTSVVARTRALKAEYTTELAQDLKSVHGLDAENELSNILSTEIIAEINREVIRSIYISSKVGASVGTATAGTFDLDVDSNGRWSVEKFKGLMFQIEREANAISQATRRGRGNFIMCSSDVASALAMAGVLDYAPALSTNLNVDEASTTFAGVLNGRYKVYIDPFAANQSATQFFVVGYKGTSSFDAGLFYCPYVPLQLVRAQDPHTFQPKIGFKTRYGIVANPFVSLAQASTGTLYADGNGLYTNSNYYYRKVRVTNLM
jgi:hypothetical protein